MGARRTALAPRRTARAGGGSPGDGAPRDRKERPLRAGAQPAFPAALGCPRLHRGARAVRPTGRRPLMMELRKLQKAALAALEDIKAREIAVFDVTHLTSMFDRVIIASADSARQLKALASHVQEKAKAAGGRVYGVDGDVGHDSALVDPGATLVDLIHPAVPPPTHTQC